MKIRFDDIDKDIEALKQDIRHLDNMLKFHRSKEKMVAHDLRETCKELKKLEKMKGNIDE